MKRFLSDPVPVFFVAVMAASAAFTLAGCGGGGGSASMPAAPSETPQSAPSALTASKPGELLAFVKDKLRERQKQRLADPASPYPVFLGAASTAGPSAADSSAVSGTTVQEQGVDEEDLLKTDGTTIVALNTQAGTGVPARLAQLQLFQRLADGKIKLTGTLDLPTQSPYYEALHGMYFVPQAAGVAVISESVAALFDLRPCIVGQPCIVPSIKPSVVNLAWIDASSAAALKAVQNISIDGRLIGSRQIGNALVLVTTHSPILPVDALPASSSDAEREALLAKLGAADILPTISVNRGAAQALLPDTDCFLQPKNASLSIDVTTITVFDLKSATLARTSRCFIGGTEALYVSPAGIYLATTRYAAVPAQSLIRFQSAATTDVHKFVLNGLAADYRGSGEVPGHLGWDPQKKPYRMSEYKGDLRILTFTGEAGWATSADSGAIAPSPATLTVLRERSNDASLQPVGQLPNAKRPAPLGLAGEQVYAVRLLGERGYVVTFRQVDPLYVLDLADPTDPHLVGELKLPGYSDYLFPLDGGLLLGVGKDASAQGRLGGVKVALLDVADPAKPRELGLQIFGERGSSSALDTSRHGVNMLAHGDVMRIALPLALRQGTTSTQGLQRLEVDTRLRSLRALAMIPAATGSADPSGERSVQIGEQVYYLSQGRLSASDW